MRQRQLRLDPAKSVSLQGQRAKKRGAQAQRMNCRADIMNEPGQSQFSRAQAAANRLIGLQHQHRKTFLCEPDRCAETVWSRTDDDRIVRNFARHSWPLKSFWMRRC